MAIKLTNVSKKFKIPHEKLDTLKESFINFYRKREYIDLDALKDVNLEVQKGEFLGIIGRNGSGKSTLLKLLANIYTPTSGDVKINGEVSPFLELGVGFNGDLSARENVYLNGVILGLSRQQIDLMYKNIVQFAELEDFMEMKLKNFSSGMQMRLAFAIASSAHADVYLCDEILAVGDREFQKKCLKVFEDLKKQGKTIILVSHDLDLVEKFCDRAVLLEKGRIVKDGRAAEVIAQYKT